MQKGFTYIEAVISLLIFSFCSISVISLFQTASQEEYNIIQSSRLDRAIDNIIQSLYLNDHKVRLNDEKYSIHYLNKEFMLFCSFQKDEYCSNQSLDNELQLSLNNQLFNDRSTIHAEISTKIYIAGNKLKLIMDIKQDLKSFHREIALSI